MASVSEHATQIAQHAVMPVQRDRLADRVELGVQPALETRKAFIPVREQTVVLEKAAQM